MSTMNIRIRKLKDKLDDVAISEKERVEILDFFSGVESISSKFNFMNWLNRLDELSDEEEE